MRTPLTAIRSFPSRTLGTSVPATGTGTVPRRSAVIADAIRMDGQIGIGYRQHPGAVTGASRDQRQQVGARQVERERLPAADVLVDFAFRVLDRRGSLSDEMVVKTTTS